MKTVDQTHPFDKSKLEEQPKVRNSASDEATHEATTELRPEEEERARQQAEGKPTSLGDTTIKKGGKGKTHFWERA